MISVIHQRHQEQQKEIDEKIEKYKNDILVIEHELDEVNAVIKAAKELENK